MGTHLVGQPVYWLITEFIKFVLNNNHNYKYVYCLLTVVSQAFQNKYQLYNAFSRARIWSILLQADRDKNTYMYVCFIKA